MAVDRAGGREVAGFAQRPRHLLGALGGVEGVAIGLLGGAEQIVEGASWLGRRTAACVDEAGGNVATRAGDAVGHVGEVAAQAEQVGLHLRCRLHRFLDPRQGLEQDPGVGRPVAPCKLREEPTPPRRFHHGSLDGLKIGDRQSRVGHVPGHTPSTRPNRAKLTILTTSFG